MRFGLGLQLTVPRGRRFTPASVQPTVWYDPSDRSTLFQSGTRAAPGAAVVNDGDPVGLVLDKSGNNIDLVQATASKRPLYKISGGISWLQFDGVDDALQSSVTLNLSAFGQLGLAFAVTPLSTAAAVMVEHGPNTNTTDKGFGIYANSATPGQIENATNVAAALDDMDTTAATFGNGVTSVLCYQSLDITQAAAALKMPLRRNGAAAAMTSLNESAAAGTVFGNQTLNIASRAGTSVFFNGKFSGLVLKGGGFTAAQRANVETYLGAKVGLVL